MYHGVSVPARAPYSHRASLGSVNSSIRLEAHVADLRPGNARELRYLVERAAILCRSGLILAEHLSLPETTETTDPPASPEADSPTSDEDQERARILSALEKARWNRREASQILGMPYSTLRYRMQKLDID